MTIKLENIGKRYRFDWIFREITVAFQSKERYAILGPNGSGKSTLLKVLSGHLSPSKGRVLFEEKGGNVPIENVYRCISYAAPYIELIEELSLEEALKFHAKLKPLLPEFTPARLYDILALPRARTKEIRFFSSGMKQRVKLAFALAASTPVLLLDEPTTNLDAQGIDWYKNFVSAYAGERLVIIASNDPHDVEICPIQLNILNYK